ncbi:MAG: hypothetical protein QG625_2849 [Cyanobacteriota bacterium erpe_2018_sw_39hr_WHONDRS-SW48-000098_B_bin.30]|nr:hypothetical protein [Cyanobacteriota bacterium erpe_2018_sw_39hr_WHONDRS-SW48-000098_B_bin.30]
MLFVSLGSELKRVPNGKKQTFECGKCKKQTTFYESSMDDSLKAFLVVELYKRSKRVMQCGECLSACDYYSLFPLEKQAEEEARQRQEAEAKERARQAEETRKKYEAEKAQMDMAVDDELEQLKKKMGK